MGVKCQVEQLLETYFMNLDNTYNKLQTLGEYIDDTEDYIQFDLDTKRNKFIEVRRARCSVVTAVTCEAAGLVQVKGQAQPG